MGYLQTADDMVNNSLKLLHNVLDSKFTQFLTGNGTPVLVDYYNIDATTSTLNKGDYTPDDILGEDSPLRYNLIKDFPVYGLKELIPSKDVLDGGLVDMSLDGEVIVLPNGIKPNGYDYIIYRFYAESGKEYAITFKVTDVEYSSIKSNDYYKLSLALRDFDDEDSENKLKKQTVRTYKTVLDSLGTNEQCVIENTLYDKIDQICGIRDYLVERYLDTFYDKRYNCLMNRMDNTFEFPTYDPFLTQFIIDNDILDTDKDYITLINFDQRPDNTRSYHKSIYHNLEIHDKTHMVNMERFPVTFAVKDTNPFEYYGEETVFTTGLTQPKDDCIDKYYYINPYHYNYINGYAMIDDMDEIPVYLDIIRDYLEKGIIYELISDEELEKLVNIQVEDSRDEFIYIPMVIFILTKYTKFLRTTQLHI